MSHVLVTLNSINVTWPIPSDNNAPITAYIIKLCQISPNNESVCVTDTTIPVSSPYMLSRNQMRYHLGEIVAQKHYEIYIQAVNSVGSQAYTPLTNGYRFESVSAVNGSVTNLRFVPTTSVVIVTWNLPAIALATSGVEAVFNLTYFRQGNQVLSTVSVIISYNMALTEQGYSVDLSVLDYGQYTFIVTAQYTSPISLLSTEVMQANIETVAAGKWFHTLYTHIHLIKCIATYTYEHTCSYVQCIIGASLSEPHIDELNARNLYMFFVTFFVW